MTGIAVIEQRDTISFKNIAIENMAVVDFGLNDDAEPIFLLNSNKIKQIQEKLKEIGYYNGKISGRLNQKLTKSIKKYQIEEGLEITDQITKKLYEKLTGTIEFAEENKFTSLQENTFNNELNYTDYGFDSFYARPNPIHISQQPRSNDYLNSLHGKTDFLFIGIFLILVAATLIGAFFIS